MFNNSPELTLISSFFAKKHNLPYQEASYTISGIGGGTTTFSSGDKGRIYNVPLLEINGSKHLLLIASSQRRLAVKKSN